jgi:polyhydroxybutyrate depolymerase
MSALVIAAMLAVLPQAGTAEQAATCGRDGPLCAVGDTGYRLAMPGGPAPQSGWPAVIFFHGWGASAAATLSNTGMVDAFVARGWAVIAPEGLVREGRTQRGWSFHPARPAQRDEAAFARAVIDDAAARHGIDRDRVMMSGFSIGGSLVWYLACRDPSLAAAYAPVAGAFWRPHPAEGDCAAPVRLLHTHGWTDGTVPLEGRPLGGGTILQGDVFHSLLLLRATNGCAGMAADGFDMGETFWRRRWTGCAPGSALEFALHQGGHSIPPGWAAMAMDWFDSVVPAAGG